MWKMTTGAGTHQTTETPACWSQVFSQLDLELKYKSVWHKAAGSYVVNFVAQKARVRCDGGRVVPAGVRPWRECAALWRLCGGVWYSAQPTPIFVCAFMRFYVPHGQNNT